MKKEKKYLNLLTHARQPAFVVENGIVVHANNRAKKLGVHLMDQIHDFLTDPHVYSALSYGYLYTMISVGNEKYNAAIEKSNHHDIFYIDTSKQREQLRTLSLAADILKPSLSDALNAAETIQQAAAENDTATNQLPILNRSLHQLHRTICNFADIPDYYTKSTISIGSCDIAALTDNLMDKAKKYLKNVRIEYTGFVNSLHCLMDQEKIERTILNLLSNAIKFREPDTPVSVNCKRINNYIAISIENHCAQAPAVIHSRFFSTYRSASGNNHNLFGFGLGIPIAQSCAVAHDGCLIAEAPDDETIRVTLMIPIYISTEAVVHSHTIHSTDYCGEFDHFLTELSDILPASYYQ